MDKLCKPKKHNCKSWGRGFHSRRPPFFFALSTFVAELRSNGWSERAKKKLLRSFADKDKAKENRYNSPMNYVYVLRSQTDPKKLYIGLTCNVEERLEQHNRGDSAYTKSFRPWTLEVEIRLKNKDVATNFEKYLKAGSGHAFLKKHLLP